MGMWLAILAGSLLILGLMRFAQSTGTTNIDKKTKQGATLFVLGLVLGFVTLVVWLG